MRIKLDNLKINIKSLATISIILLIIILAIGYYINTREKSEEEANYLYTKAVHEMAVGLEKGDPVRLKNSMDLFDYISRTGKGDISIIAKLMKARILYEIGKKEEGTKLAKEAIKDLSNSNPLKAVFLPLAQDESEFEKFIESKKTFLPDYAMYEYAILLLDKNKKDKANEILSKLKNEYPNSPFTKDLEKIMEVEN